MTERNKMRQKYFNIWRTFTITLALLIIGIPNVESRSNAGSKTGNSSYYQLTIYVDEGDWPGDLNGHVFFGLTAGDTTVYRGWHSKNKLLAPLALGGGEVRDDSPLIDECKWDVRKTYSIRQADFNNAVNIINNWSTDGRNWAITHHCGDFTEAVALAAGLPIKLSFNTTEGGKNRPGLFGEYLRNHGGTPNSETYYVNSYVNTGIELERGDKVSIRAGGEVIFGPSVGSAGPDGKRAFMFGLLPLPIDPSLNFFVQFPHGCLIGRVKRGGDRSRDNWFYLGAGRERVVEESGTLELNVNDTYPVDNRGKFEVVVKVCRAN